VSRIAVRRHCQREGKSGLFKSYSGSSPNRHPSLLLLLSQVDFCQCSRCLYRNHADAFLLSVIYNREIRECLVMNYTSAVFGFVQRYIDNNLDS
jgi:hypothetical protein